MCRGDEIQDGNALKLHDDCRKAVLRVLNENLGSVLVKHGQFVDHTTTGPLQAVDEVLPRTGSVRKRLEELVGDQPAYTVALGYLDGRLKNEASFESEAARRPVADVLETTEAAIAAAILDQLESLPWELMAATVLPPRIVDHLSAVEGGSQIELAPHLTIQLADGDLGSHWQPPDSLLSFLPPPEQRSPGPLIQFSCRGFVRPYGDSPAVGDARESFLAFAGLGIALGLLTDGTAWRPTPQPKPIQVFRIPGAVDPPVFMASHDLPLDLSDFFFGLGPGYVFDASLKDSPAWRAYRVRQIELLRRAFSTARAASIRRGAQWLVESLARRNNALLSFIQGTVALEILLGEKASSDVVGIAELLANRCAYLVGQSHSERDRLTKDVKDIYSTRSRIVHSGHSRLTGAQTQQLGKLRTLCVRVIARELELLSAPSPPDAS